MPAFYGLLERLVDGRKRPTLALVVPPAAHRHQAILDGAQRHSEGGPGMVRGAGLCRGRDRNSADLPRQRDPPACASHRTYSCRWYPRHALPADLAGIRLQEIARRGRAKTVTV